MVRDPLALVMLPNDDVLIVADGLPKFARLNRLNVLEAELELEAFLDREVLEHGNIDRLRTRTIEQIAAGISIGIVIRSDRVQVRDCESGRVDAPDQMVAPTVCSRCVNQVWPVSAAGGRVRGVGSR